MLLNAYASKNISYANMKILEHDAMTYSINEYENILTINKSTLGQKAQNFDRLWTWINSTNPTKLYLIGQGELLLSYVQGGIRFSQGEARLTREVFEPTGSCQIKPESA